MTDLLNLIMAQYYLLLEDKTSVIVTMGQGDLLHNLNDCNFSKPISHSLKAVYILALVKFSSFISQHCFHTVSSTPAELDAS